MNIHATKETVERYYELKNMIVDKEERPISKRKLFKILIDIAYDKLIKGEADGE